MGFEKVMQQKTNESKHENSQQNTENPFQHQTSIRFIENSLLVF